MSIRSDAPITQPNRRPTMRWYGGCAAVLGWSALAIQLCLVLAARRADGKSLIGGVINYLSFFTILSNTLAALALTMPRLSANSKVGEFFSRPTVNAGIAVAMAVVGLTYSLLLRQLWQPQGLQLVADVLLHDGMPIIFLLYWWLYVPRAMLRWRDSAGWLAYPASYLVYALLRGATFGLYPYPFIDAAQLGYLRVFYNAAGMLAGFMAVSALVILADRGKGKSHAG